MARRLTVLLLALLLLCGLATPAFALEDDDYSSEEYFEYKIEGLVEIVQVYGLYYDEDTDIIGDALAGFVEQNPGYAKEVDRSKLPQFFAAHPELFEQFADIMYQNHDVHSHYMDAVTYESSYEFEETYVGIGIEVDTSVTVGLVVLNVFPGTPADEAGVLPGDEVIEVDGTDVTELFYAEISDMLRGEEGTDTSIKVRREEKVLEFTLTRRVIVLSNIEFTDLGDGVAYIRITHFGDSQTFVDFLNVYQDLPYDGFRSVIIDLRYNLGGSLDSAYNMLNYVFWEADAPMFSIYSRDMGLETYTSSGAGWKPNLVCVLVNEYTVSSSELFAGALQRNDVATIIGTTTYGKGVGQYHLPLWDGSTAVVTNFEIWLGGDDATYNEIGVIPDIERAETEVVLDVSALEPLRGTRTLYNGHTGSDVLALEQRLEVLGLFEGTPDKVFDANTREAVKLFQTYENLPVVNYASYATYIRLNALINSLDGYTYYIDTAFETAYELAVEAAKEPLDYELRPRTFEEYDAFYGETDE